MGRRSERTRLKRYKLELVKLDRYDLSKLTQLKPYHPHWYNFNLFKPKLHKVDRFDSIKLLRHP